MDSATSDFHNGMLLLTLPKAEEAKPRRIPVTSGAGRQDSRMQESGSRQPGTGPSQQASQSQGSQQSQNQGGGGFFGRNREKESSR
jgi:hypothetical protein